MMYLNLNMIAGLSHAPALIAAAAGLFDPSVLSLVGNGGVGVALILSHRMWLGYLRERDRTMDAVLARFEAKLSEIDARHVAESREGRDQFAGLIDRHIAITRACIESQVALKAVVEANVETTRANTAAIERLERGWPRDHDPPRPPAQGP